MRFGYLSCCLVHCRDGLVWSFLHWLLQQTGPSPEFSYLYLSGSLSVASTFFPPWGRIATILVCFQDAQLMETKVNLWLSNCLLLSIFHIVMWLENTGYWPTKHFYSMEGQGKLHWFFLTLYCGSADVASSWKQEEIGRGHEVDFPFLFVIFLKSQVKNLPANESTAGGFSHEQILKEPGQTITWGACTIWIENHTKEHIKSLP